MKTYPITHAEINKLSELVETMAVLSTQLSKLNESAQAAADAQEILLKVVTTKLVSTDLLQTNSGVSPELVDT